jgi:TonB-linked SusC/RagA family outer membrane protein
MINKILNPSIFIFLMSLFAITVYAQQNITVKGTVKDENNNPLIGVSLYSTANSKIIGVSDRKGEFSIKTIENDEIRFQNVGYSPQKIKVSKEQSNLQIILESLLNMMEETVVVGYQARARETMTGSSVIISGKDLQNVPVSNVMELLQGRVAGLNIQNNTGMPGAMGTINIRGVSNINVSGTGNDAFLTPTTPLFVIDGVPVDNNSDYQYGFEQQGPGLSPLSMIPVEDIEQVEVLKDAQATSLYGSRGAYGVILVTTKRGKSKTPIVQYTSNVFMSNPPALRKTMGGVQERLLRIDQLLRYDTSYRHALEVINFTPILSDSLNPYYNNSTDWQSYFYRTTFNQTHNANISGGDELFNYKVNTGLYDEKGIVRGTGFKRYNLNMNMQYQPNRKFKLSSYINAALGDNSAGSGNSLRQTGIANGSNSSSLLPSPSIYSSL